MTRHMLVLFTLLGVALAQAPTSPQWHAASARLVTKWAAEVGPENAWPEYPRPSLRRDAWQNLNGLWDYAITAGTATMPEKADGEILVPFAVESALSGVGKPLLPDQRLWYRRVFTLPDVPAWRDHHVLLHCDAIDWEAEVWVDGVRVGDHRGGYDRFSFDITSRLGKSPEHVLLIGVRDPSDSGPQPRGKQVLKPGGIWYTASSGIWQTVWLEPVPATYVRGVRWTADERQKTYRIEPDLIGLRPGDRWRAHAIAAIPSVPSESVDAEGDAGTVAVTLTSHFFRVWQPGAPHLQTVEVSILRDGKVVDTVQTDVAMRGLPDWGEAGSKAFQFGPLDQGYWPDGLYTPPSFAAMCADLDAIQAMGCTMLRKHAKVESELFYHECDKRGLYVWQDMPSGDTQNDPDQFERELHAMIDTHRQHPSIVMWVIFNEGWGQHDTLRYCKLVRQWDPTRWIDNASGWTDQECGDVIDMHVYPGPAMLPPERQRVSVVGEFGGLGMPVPDHTWATKDNWGYVSFRSSEELTREYVARIDELRPLRAMGLAAAVYTQTTDVEVEVNGWLTYDRAVTKVDVGAAAAAAARLQGDNKQIAWPVPDAQQSRPTWRWTTTEPAADWTKPAFDDGSWSEGIGGFGTRGTPGARIGTEWKTDSIWLRRSFEVGVLQDPFFSLHHDEDIEVLIDGVSVLSRSGYTTGYGFVAMSDTCKKLLTPGRHELAVHCRQTAGGQYVDVGIADLEPSKR